MRCCYDMKTFLFDLCEYDPLVTLWVHTQRVSNGQLWVFFFVTLCKLLNKQSDCQWFDTTRCSRVTVMYTLCNRITACMASNFDINSSPPGQTDRHFPDDIFKYIFMNYKLCILIRIKLMFVPKVPINNIPGGRLNKKDGLTRYGDSHVKDKTS